MSNHIMQSKVMGFIVVVTLACSMLFLPTRSVMAQCVEGASSCGPTYSGPDVLDTSIDRCSRPVVWIWDAQLNWYVGIRKGDQGIVVNLSDRGFQWWCGWEDRLGTEEWARGPEGTGQVRVSRASSGRKITWEFLSMYATVSIP